jgi:hypothetical protein
MDGSRVAAVAPARLRRTDYLVLTAFCLVLFGFAVVNGRRLSGHESVQPETAREMLSNHDWLIPRMGGEPWLERPPLPSWFIAGVDILCGDAASTRVARAAPVFAAVLIVCLVGSMAARWYGRTIGLLTGLILATMWEFFSFASDPEADIFLCAITTAAFAVFALLEWPDTPRVEAAAESFWGRRSRLVLGFFVLLGMTNLAKGLIFGTLMVLVPVAGFLLWNADRQRLRRYVWFWGGLVFLVVSLAWPLAAYLSYPEIVDLWRRHYLGRLYQGYVGEPVWYYAITLPYVLLPWSFVAAAGLWLTRMPALRQRYSPECFLWCWGLLVPAFFSIPNGKHHHYLLPCLAPWAVFAAIGTRALWQALQVGLARVKQPALVLVLSDGRRAGAVFFGFLLVSYLLGYALQTHYDQSYDEDLVFLDQVRQLVPSDRQLLVHYDAQAELETFWVLFYGPRGMPAFYDANELRALPERDKVVYVLARAYDYGELDYYGSAEVVLQSQRTRSEHAPGQRRTLFRVRVSAETLPNVARRPQAVSTPR